MTLRNPTVSVAFYPPTVSAYPSYRTTGHILAGVASPLAFQVRLKPAGSWRRGLMPRKLVHFLDSRRRHNIPEPFVLHQQTSNKVPMGATKASVYKLTVHRLRGEPHPQMLQILVSLLNTRYLGLA